MSDDLFDRICAATPNLPDLTEAETFRLKAYLDRYPAPPTYARSEVKRRILCVWDETDPDDEQRWIHLHATLEYNTARHRARATTAEPDTKSSKPLEPNVKSNVTLDARALAVFLEHTDWSKKRIAQHLGCNEKSLCPARCPRLAAAIAAHTSTIDPGRRRLRGSKDANGNLEAWEENE
jgi:hypothetical protein